MHSCVCVHVCVWGGVCVKVWWNNKHLDANNVFFELQRKRSMIKIVHLYFCSISILYTYISIFLPVNKNNYFMFHRCLNKLWLRNLKKKQKKKLFFFLKKPKLFRVLQAQHYWHLEPANLLWGALRIVGCLAASLSSVHQMPVAYCQLWWQKMSPDIVKCPLGTKLPQVQN